MYFNYTTRSLLRGGQRTVLALFCVAVGVMAIVALQLVGLMINNALTSNVRDANGGDINVTSNSKPFTTNDLSFFDSLKSSGTITNYTAFGSSTGALGNAASVTSNFTIDVVDPATYPVVTPPTFVNPSNGSIANLLTDGNAIVDKSFADQFNKKVGDTVTVHGSSNTDGRNLVLQVKIAGIVTDSGSLAQNRGVMLISRSYFATVAPNTAKLFSTVDITTTDQQHTDKAVQSINAQFPLANTQTAADALKSQQGLVDNIKKFLEIAGLLALLIGGVGIVNTMQVLLSRRKIEIAMLKTTGYRRVDLYLLFGLEAGLLGLAGGVIGALAATGVSYLVRGLVQQTFSINIPFVLDPLTIGGGVLIGLVTALIFGLMPIVQAANIRPLNVIRELPSGNRTGTVALTIGLLLLLSVLFCILSVVILNDVVSRHQRGVRGIRLPGPFEPLFHAGGAPGGKTACTRTLQSSIPGPARIGRGAFGADRPGSADLWLPATGADTGGFCGCAATSHLEIQHENGSAQYWSPARSHHDDPAGSVCRHVYHRIDPGAGTEFA